MGFSQLNKSQSPFTDSESDVRLLRACRTMHLAALMQDPAADQLRQGRLSPQEGAEEQKRILEEVMFVGRQGRGVSTLFCHENNTPIKGS